MPCGLLNEIIYYMALRLTRSKEIGKRSLLLHAQRSSHLFNAETCLPFKMGKGTQGSEKKPETKTDAEETKLLKGIVKETFLLIQHLSSGRTFILYLEYQELNSEYCFAFYGNFEEEQCIYCAYLIRTVLSSYRSSILCKARLFCTQPNKMNSPRLQMTCILTHPECTRKSTAVHRQ